MNERNNHLSVVEFQPTINPELIHTLEMLLDSAIDGKIQGIAYVIQCLGDKVSNGWNMDSPKTLMFVGEIEMLKLELLDAHRKYRDEQYLQF